MSPVRSAPVRRYSPVGDLELFLVGVTVPLALLGVLAHDGWLTGEAVAAIIGGGLLQALRLRSDRLWLPADLTVYRGHPVLIGWLKAHGLDADEVLQVRVEGRKVVAEVAIRNDDGQLQLTGSAADRAVLTRTVTRPLRQGVWKRLWTRHLNRTGL